MMKKYLYELKEAAEFVGISTSDLYREVYEGGIDYQFDDEIEYQNDTDALRFHWSDLVELKVSLKSKKGQFPANLGGKKAAEYLGISKDDLDCYLKLGWLKPDVPEFMTFSEASLDKFLVNKLAPISKVINIFR